jgi:hypothetical protein
MASSATLFKSAVCRTNAFPRPNPTLIYFPGISNETPIYDNNSEFLKPISTVLESNFKKILKEYHDLVSVSGIKNDYQSGDHKLHSGDWKWNSCKYIDNI